MDNFLIKLIKKRNPKEIDRASYEFEEEELERQNKTITNYYYMPKKYK